MSVCRCGVLAHVREVWRPSAGLCVFSDGCMVASEVVHGGWQPSACSRIYLWSVCLRPTGVCGHPLGSQGARPLSLYASPAFDLRLPSIVDRLRGALPRPSPFGYGPVAIGGPLSIYAMSELLPAALSVHFRCTSKQNVQIEEGPWCGVPTLRFLSVGALDPSHCHNS